MGYMMDRELFEKQRAYNQLNSQLIETISFGVRPLRLTRWQMVLMWLRRALKRPFGSR